MSQSHNTSCDTSCQMPQNGEAPSCACQRENKAESSTLGEKIRQGGLFLVACLASPCCTPLFVPIVLSVFAGTSLGLWLTQNLFWVYGLLTLISIVSMVLLFRPKSQRKTTSQSLISVSSISIGVNPHVKSTK